MSVFCQAVVYLLVALPAVAQSEAFATITIKPARSADPRNAHVQVLPNGLDCQCGLCAYSFELRLRRAGQPFAASFRSSRLDPS
jgi:hypothetical protein